MIKCSRGRFLLDFLRWICPVSPFAEGLINRSGRNLEKRENGRDISSARGSILIAFSNSYALEWVFVNLKKTGVNLLEFQTRNKRDKMYRERGEERAEPGG